MVPFLRTPIFLIYKMTFLTWISTIFSFKKNLGKWIPLVEGFNFFRIGFCKISNFFILTNFQVIPSFYVYFSIFPPSFFSCSLDFYFLTTHGTRINPELKLTKDLFTQKGFCTAMMDFNRSLISQGSFKRITSTRIFMKNSSKRGSSSKSSDDPESSKTKDSVSPKDFV